MLILANISLSLYLLWNIKGISLVIYGVIFVIWAFLSINNLDICKVLLLVIHLIPHTIVLISLITMRWFALIFADFCWFSLILLCWSSLIIVLIFTNILIFYSADFCADFVDYWADLADLFSCILHWSLLIYSTDCCWIFVLIFFNSCIFILWIGYCYHLLTQPLLGLREEEVERYKEYRRFNQP